MITGGLVPVLPSFLLEPLWDQFAALLPEHVDTRPLGRHNPRIPDRLVFDHVIAALVHGSGYERIASRGCSDRTIRRRVKYWARLGIAEQIHALALQAYDRMIGLELDEAANVCDPRSLSTLKTRGFHHVTPGRRPSPWATRS